MGFLTPFLFRNDSIHELKNKKIAKQIVEKIIESCSQHKPHSLSTNYPNGGGSCNAVECLGTGHMDESRLILIYGNTWLDLSRETYELSKSHDVHKKFLKDAAKIAERELKLLKKALKNLEEKKNA